MAISAADLSAITAMQCPIGSAALGVRTVSSSCPRTSRASVAACSRSDASPSPAPNSAARASSRSPSSTAMLLPHNAFAEATPCRAVAASMTSSW